MMYLLHSLFTDIYSWRGKDNQEKNICSGWPPSAACPIIFSHKAAKQVSSKGLYYIGKFFPPAAKKIYAGERTQALSIKQNMILCF
ncbi:hypothetical protein [Chitinophaga jiangningensis]|uniref:hypothetical protein n=1 Tax=Chitinophaga jiangningensis TaxID=1419482 RepID=UPI0015B7146C|nr:hypothetical protein [Chitinophaga jiangningensis]